LQGTQPVNNGPEATKLDIRGQERFLARQLIRPASWRNCSIGPARMVMPIMIQFNGKRPEWADPKACNSGAEQGKLRVVRTETGA
jgi:hypothetical protein